MKTYFPLFLVIAIILSIGLSGCTLSEQPRPINTQELETIVVDRLDDTDEKDIDNSEDVVTVTGTGSDTENNADTTDTGSTLEISKDLKKEEDKTEKDDNDKNDESSSTESNENKAE